MGWGWNPETVGSLATAGTAVFAAIAAAIAVRELRGQRLRERRAQAVLLGAWTEVTYPDDPDEYGGVRLRLHVANRSDLPVTDVVVRCAPSLAGNDPLERRWHSLGPGEFVEDLVGQTDPHDALGSPRKVIQLSFTDNSGTSWVRKGGYLHVAKRRRP